MVTSYSEENKGAGRPGTSGGRSATGSCRGSVSAASVDIYLAVSRKMPASAVTIVAREDGRTHTWMAHRRAGCPVSKPTSWSGRSGSGSRPC
jgi:hypothetical protein